MEIEHTKLMQKSYNHGKSTAPTTRKEQKKHIKLETLLSIQLFFWQEIKRFFAATELIPTFLNNCKGTEPPEKQIWIDVQNYSTNMNKGLAVCHFL